jgi:hypothetical protein
VTNFEWAAIVASLAGLLASACALTVAAVGTFRNPDDKVARFAYGHLGVFGLCLGIGSCMAVVDVAGTHVGSSWVASAAVVAVNLLVQPFALLLCWTAVRKIALGMCGHVAYAWMRVPDAELAGLAPAECRRLSLYCVLQGVVVLPWGACMSLGAAEPLILWAVA